MKKLYSFFHLLLLTSTLLHAQVWQSQNVPDSQGQLLRREVVENVAEFRQEVDLRGLAAGAYALRIASPQGVVSRRLVKN
jgi:hypothetical protein